MTVTESVLSLFARFLPNTHRNRQFLLIFIAGVGFGVGLTAILFRVIYQLWMVAGIFAGTTLFFLYTVYLTTGEILPRPTHSIHD